MQLYSGLHYVSIAHTRNILEDTIGTTAEGEAIPEEGQWGVNEDC